MRIALTLLLLPILAQAGSWQCELKDSLGRNPTSIFMGIDEQGKLEPQARVVMLGMSQFLPVQQRAPKEGEIVSALISPDDFRTRLSVRILAGQREDRSYKGVGEMNAGILPKQLLGSCHLW